jgi:polysaccharide export outer membrane protein
MHSLFLHSKWSTFLLVILLLGIISCAPARKGMVLHGLQPGKDSIDRLAMEASKRVYPGDRILVRILYPQPGEILLDMFLEAGSGQQMMNQQNTTGGNGGGVYLVDKNGTIEIVGLGSLQVTGLTSKEIADAIKTHVSGLYKDAYVRCMYMGRVLFLGGAGLQGSVPIGEDRMSILDALAIRGMGEPSARRDRVWVIRETGDIREYGLVDLTKKELYRSPYFYLRNNDIVYLEPNKINTFLNVNAPVRNVITTVVSSIAILLSLLTFLR